MMNWTYPQLKTDIGALSPIPSTNAAIATALQAETVQLPAQDIPTDAAQDVLLLASTGDWAKIVLRSRRTPSGASPPTTDDAAISAAILAVAVISKASIGASSDAVWTRFSAAMQALVAAGDMSSASMSAITALRTPTVPKYDPAPTADDVAKALSL